MVGYPYTKLMTAIMDVDMAAAVLVASDEAADSLGVPADRRVYLRGWGYAEDPVALGARGRPLAVGGHGGGRRCRPVRCRSRGGRRRPLRPLLLLHQLDRVRPRRPRVSTPSVHAPRDPNAPERPVTVTGGLAYHGGPGSNYMTHSLATMAEQAAGRTRARSGWSAGWACT